MTETKNHIPGEHHNKASITFDENQQPRLFFDKLCKEAVHIERSINGKEWQLLAENARSPYTDQTDFEEGGEIRYRIRFGTPEEDTVQLSLHLPD
ncbi:MAG: hypothetical protein ACLFUB_06920 [Cyclobacteriaceae bacterium]